MAAATRRGADINDSGGGRRRRFPIVPILLLLIVVGAIVAVFVFNVFDVREQYVFAPLRNVPVIGDYIPAAPLAEDAAEAAPEIADPEIAALMEQIESLRAQLNASQALNTQYEETVQMLQGYQNVVTEYRENKRLFDEMIANGDPDAFANFFEGIDPDTAARLFAQIREQQQVDRDFRRYASTYAEMDTGEAAGVFSILLMTDALLVVGILESFNPAQRAEIFNEMAPEDVAILAILMAPQADDPLGILPNVPLIDAPSPDIPLIDSAGTADIENIGDEG